MPAIAASLEKLWVKFYCDRLLVKFDGEENLTNFNQDQWSINFICGFPEKFKFFLHKTTASKILILANLPDNFDRAHHSSVNSIEIQFDELFMLKINKLICYLHVLQSVYLWMHSRSGWSEQTGPSVQLV